MKLSTDKTIDLMKPLPGLAYLDWVLARCYHDRTRFTQ